MDGCPQPAVADGSRRVGPALQSDNRPAEPCVRQAQRHDELACDLVNGLVEALSESLGEIGKARGVVDEVVQSDRLH